MEGDYFCDFCDRMLSSKEVNRKECEVCGRDQE